MDRQSVGLESDGDFHVDVHKFRDLIAECTAHGHAANETCASCSNLLSAAIDLYRGDFLAGFSLKDSANFDDWQLAETESLRSEMELAFDRLVRCHIEQKELARGIGCAHRWLKLDRSNETAHRHLIDLLARSGQRTAALRQYEQCVLALDEELGVAPDRAMVQLYEDIKADQAPAIEANRPGNLPRQLTSFIGRRYEMR